MKKIQLKSIRNIRHFVSLVVLIGCISNVSATGASAEPPIGGFEVTHEVDFASIAVTAQGDIWGAGYTDAWFFPKAVSADSVPTKQITGFAKAIGIAVDRDGNVYVAEDTSSNHKSGKLYVLSPSATHRSEYSRAIDIVGAQYIFGIIVDSEGYIYVSSDSTPGISVYKPGITEVTNDVAIRTIRNQDDLLNKYSGLALGINHEIVASSDSQHSLTVFGLSESGTVLAKRSLKGSNTGLSGPAQISVDVLGRIYVASYGLSGSIRIFSGDSTGNAAPLKYFSGGVINSPYPLALGLDGNIWFANWDTGLFASINNPYTSARVVWDPLIEDEQPLSNEEAIKLSIQEIARERQNTINRARDEVRNSLVQGIPITAQGLIEADIPGVTAKNVDSINADLAKLPEDKRGDIAEVVKVVFKFATVDKIANQERVVSSDLISVGLVKPESKVVTSIMIELKRLPASSLDTFEKIQAAVAAVEKKYADRKARLAAILSR